MAHKGRRTWADDELEQAQLGDERRTERLIDIAQARSRQPEASLPESLGTKSEVKAGYRFYENESVDASAIQKAHADQTIKRAKESKSQIVLSIQDTTHVEMSGRDVWIHSTLMATPDRIPHGLLGAKIWEREIVARTSKKDHRKKAIEDKESSKWLGGLELTGQRQEELGEEQQVVFVADRESDVYEVIDKAERTDIKVLIRAVQNRKIAEEEGYLKACVANQPIAGELLVDIGRNGTRAERQAKCEVRYATATILPPKRLAAKKDLEPITVQVIWVLETGERPAGAAQIEWLLLTTLPISNVDQALEWVNCYSVRWLIEMYHKVLKSGCQIEERLFDDLDNFKRYLAIDSIVAWRILHMTLLPRKNPDVACDEVLESHEWRALYIVTHETRPPTIPPRLADAIVWIAKLGGYLARKGDGPPGTIVIWRGMARLQSIAFGLFLSENVGKG